jgi:hypothetical protein
MKRINEKTELPFKQGDVREDGKIFVGYSKTRIRKDGYFCEDWVSKDYFSEKTEYKKEWFLKNTEKRKVYNKKWNSENLGKKNVFTAKYRATKLQRTPPWLTKEHQLQIEGFYLLAKEMEKQLGGKYDVDHIEPLNGDEVSGLHAPWNLQVLPKSANIKKSNKRM